MNLSVDDPVTPMTFLNRCSFLSLKSNYNTEQFSLYNEYKAHRLFTYPMYHCCTLWMNEWMKDSIWSSAKTVHFCWAMIDSWCRCPAQNETCCVEVSHRAGQLNCCSLGWLQWRQQLFGELHLELWSAAHWTHYETEAEKKQIFGHVITRSFNTVQLKQL